MDRALGWTSGPGLVKDSGYHILMSNANAMLFRSLSQLLSCKTMTLLSLLLVTVLHVNLIIWLFGFLCLVILNRIVDIAQDSTNTILVLHIQL
jgi:hypothetical protein